MKRTIASYIELLKEYNTHTNVYSKSAYDKLPFHINDSLAIAGLIENKSTRIIDIGSGSGLPAIPIAITNPKNLVIAIDSKRRKTDFLLKVKKELSLENLTVITININEYIHSSPPKATIITAKAFGSYTKIKPLAAALTQKGRSRLIIPISQAQMNTIKSAEKNPNITYLVNKEDNLYHLIESL